MNTRMLLLGCLLAVAVQAQESKRELWKWKDANGVTHYSDRPVQGATRVEVTTMQPVPAAAPPPPSRTRSTASQRSTPAVVQYQSLEIWQPESEQSFFGTDNTVTVRLRSEPELAAGDQLRLFFDGKQVESGTNADTYTLPNVERGAHVLEALIVDDQGTVRIRSEPVVFHVMQPSVNAPRAVGPSLKPAPPPKPTPKSNSPK
jgi:hypothetical protein